MSCDSSKQHSELHFNAIDEGNMSQSVSRDQTDNASDNNAPVYLDRERENFHFFAHESR